MPEQTRVIDYLPSNRVVQGENALLSLPAILSESGCRNILVVTDPGLISAGHVHSLSGLIDQTGAQYSVFSEVSENPTTLDVDKGVAFAQEQSGLDLIIAIGGGSAMDCAKGINFLFTNGGRMQDYWGKNRAGKPMLPSIGIPTTTGTGSEAQSFALITDPQSHRKMACGDHKARFRTVILDPSLVKTAPRQVLAVTGVDAISHAIESFVSKPANAFSKMFAKEAWRLLSSNFESILGDNATLTNFSEMQLGAYLAGLSIENAMLGAAHACANPLTAQYGLTHGIAVGVMLPHVVAFNAEAAEAGYQRLNDDGPAELVVRLNHYLELAGIDVRLRDYGIYKQELPMLSSMATEEWTGKFNPRELDKAAFLALYQAAF